MKTVRFRHRLRDLTTMAIPTSWAPRRNTRLLNSITSSTTRPNLDTAPRYLYRISSNESPRSELGKKRSTPKLSAWTTPSTLGRRISSPRLQTSSTSHQPTRCIISLPLPTFRRRLRPPTCIRLTPKRPPLPLSPPFSFPILCTPPLCRRSSIQSSHTTPRWSFPSKILTPSTRLTRTNKSVGSSRRNHPPPRPPPPGPHPLHHTSHTTLSTIRTLPPPVHSVATRNPIRHASPPPALLRLSTLNLDDRT